MRTRAPSTTPLLLVAVVLALLLLAAAIFGVQGAGVARTPETAVARAVGAGFRGVLVQRTTPFMTYDSNNSIPDFDTLIYDTGSPEEPMWEDERHPERITIPASWDGLFAIVYARGAWEGNDDFWVEMKLYRNAERPIGDDTDAKAIAVTQHAPNLGSPFQELTAPPIQVFEGDFFTITFRTPDRQRLIPYEQATTLFGAYLVQGGEAPLDQLGEASR